MDEQRLTREELFLYATLDDLEHTNDRMNVLESQTRVIFNRLEEEAYNVRCISGTFAETVSAVDTAHTYTSEIDRISNEIAQIKEALLDIQDSLRRLGMDDMSHRLGDLNLLLT